MSDDDDKLYEDLKEHFKTALKEDQLQFEDL